MLEALRGGGEVVWAAIYKKHRAAVLLFAQNEVARCYEDGEEITNDAFLRAHKDINNFEIQDNATFQTWLIQLARNAGLNFYKSPANRYDHQSPQMTELTEEPCRDGLPDEYELTEAIRLLPNKERDAIRKTSEGRPCREIAGGLGVSTTTAWRIRERGKKRLRARTVSETK